MRQKKTALSDAEKTALSEAEKTALSDAENRLLLSNAEIDCKKWICVNKTNKTKQKKKF